jgi:hypothetical protein
MGLEASIEKVFRRAMESDLELIAQNVSAQTSSNTTPQGSCMCACNISATVIQNNGQRLEEQLYSVDRIVFRPVDNFPEIMNQRIREADAHPQAHGPHLDTLRTLLTNGPRMRNQNARRLAQNQVLGLIGTLARHYQDEGPYVTIAVRGNVITMGVVDYVLRGLSGRQIDRLIRANQLRVTPIPALERWPEEVVIAGRRNRVYRRADLAVGLRTVPRRSRPPRPIPPHAGHPPPPWTLRQVVAGRI